MSLEHLNREELISLIDELATIMKSKLRNSQPQSSSTELPSEEGSFRMNWIYNSIYNTYCRVFNWFSLCRQPHD